ncbi:Arginine metabolism regulation protein II [Lachnellula occidentalis]|uniref:Arginine metabolism regulation protein II n=1 Tax=Lachnellula occidentalis TaxID=215460 RepID=A0A8H8RYN8_9HELO|nr:Arginine metabolism regulation protein II [Lachnellula occidentalis]
MQGESTNRPRKSRSFTLSRPPVNPRKPIKRSKTYTGCWTCRSRGIKCDERRPSCGQCLKANRCCEGYHVKLVWDNEHWNSRKPVERRTFIAQDARQPVLSSREIRLALDRLDASDTANTVLAGPFAVFPAAEHTEISEDLVESALDQVTEPSSEVIELWNCGTEEIERCFDDGESTHGIEILEEGDDHGYNEKTEAAHTMMSIKQKILPQVMNYLSFATPEERSLFHYWVTYLSGLMIPTQRVDNPFRTIFIPLALAGPALRQDSSGNAALLHTIYAVSAFNRAQLSSNDEYLVLGTKHHKIALGHLRKNLLQPEETQREAILATIITMSSIEVINGESARYRTHLAGGKIWLQYMMKKGVVQSDSASVLCQIFFCINALVIPSSTTIADPELPRLINQLEDRQATQSDSVWPLWGTTYALDKLFGITKPILEGIIDDLDLFIRRNDPDVLLSDLDECYDEITRHHTCAFFCASLIYFERRVRKTSQKKLQRLVQRSLDHLEAIRSIEVERNMDVCGLLWPEFVTACETEDVNNLRSRAISLFKKGKLRGIGNILSAERVVLEVWQRRDNNCEGPDMTWHSAMTDMGLDILLT